MRACRTSLGAAPSLVLCAALCAACGGSGAPQPSSTASSTATAPAPAATATTAARATTAPAPPVAPLTGESASAATGDIPDNQVFLTFADAGARWAMRYPEGWAQSGAHGDVTFRDKNNIVHVVVRRGPAPTVASVSADLASLAAANASVRVRPAAVVSVGGRRAIKATYTVASAVNPVTGKRVTLIVDRYALARAGRVAVVDLGTPVGVDNVDAYRLMVESFAWR